MTLKARKTSTIAIGKMSPFVIALVVRHEMSPSEIPNMPLHGINAPHMKPMATPLCMFISFKLYRRCQEMFLAGDNVGHDLRADLQHIPTDDEILRLPSERQPHRHSKPTARLSLSHHLQPEPGQEVALDAKERMDTSTGRRRKRQSAVLSASTDCKFYCTMMFYTASLSRCIIFFDLSILVFVYPYLYLYIYTCICISILVFVYL